MAQQNSEYGLMDILKSALGYFNNVIIATIFPKIAEGTDLLMDNIEERMIHIEKRMLRKLSSLLVIGAGGAFLVFAVFFSLIQYFGMSYAAASFSVGITVLVAGLLLKLGENSGSER